MYYTKHIVHIISFSCNNNPTGDTSLFSPVYTCTVPGSERLQILSKVPQLESSMVRMWTQYSLTLKPSMLITMLYCLLIIHWSYHTIAFWLPTVSLRASEWFVCVCVCVCVCLMLLWKKCVFHSHLSFLLIAKKFTMIHLDVIDLYDTARSL